MELKKGWFQKKVTKKKVECYFWENGGSYIWDWKEGSEEAVIKDLIKTVNEQDDIDGDEEVTNKWNVQNPFTCNDLESLKRLRFKYKEKEDRVILPTGAYDIIASIYDRPHLSPVEFRDENIIATNSYNRLKEDIDDFLVNKDLYHKNNIFYKRGYLMWGTPGEGKTSIIRKLFKDCPDTLVFFCTDVPLKDFVRNLEEYEKDRLKVFIIEEISTYTEDNSKKALLDFLDGENSVSNSIVIATTNYPEELPSNILDRPSRFDFVMEVKSPNLGEIQQLVKAFIGRTPLEEDVKCLEGLSTAAIKEVCLFATIKQMSYERAFEEIEKRSIKNAKAFKKDNTKGVGFKN